MTSLVKQLKRPQSRLKDIIEEEERGYDMLIITFNSSITKIELVPKGRICWKRNGVEVLKTEHDTDSGFEVVKVAPDAFGFIDAILSKDPVHILVLGKLQGNADINRLMDLIVDIAPEIDGKMSLSINPAQNEYIIIVR